MNELPPTRFLSVVIPCFNEASTLSEVLTDIIRTFDDGGLRDRYELILVDDGSTDDSAAVVRSLAAQFSQIKGVYRETNGGMWRAIHSGFMHVHGDFVTYLPADGEIGAKQVLTLVQYANDHDMVLSDREPMDAEVRQAVRPWYRVVLTWGHRLCIKAFLGFDIEGAEGILLLRWNIFRPWATAPRSDNILFLELLARGFKAKVRIARTVTYYEFRRAGRSKIIKIGYILDTAAAIVRLGMRIRASK